MVYNQWIANRIVILMLVLWCARDSSAYLAAIPEIRPAVLSNPRHNCFHLYLSCGVGRCRDVPQCSVMPSMAKFYNCAICALFVITNQTSVIFLSAFIIIIGV